MLPYWVLFSLFAAGAVQYPTDFRKRLQGGPLLLAAGFATLLMIGLRYEVGGDWDNYINILDEVSRDEFWVGVWRQDPGYGLLNWLAARFGMGMWAVNLACALAFTWGLVRFARRQPNPWLVMVVAVPYLIIVVAMGYTRQAVAIGFILAGLAVLEQGLLRFSIYLAFAVTFHKSAVVVLPLVALSASYRRFVTVGILLVSAVILYYAFVQASVDRLMTVYVQYSYASQGAGVRVAMNLPPALIFLFFQRRFTASDQERKLWRNFSIAGLAALAMLELTSATTAVDRLALYIIPLQMFVLGRLPFAFHSKRGPSAAITLMVIAYSATIEFVWLNYAANAPFWIPYQFYPSAHD
ncbi:MAG: hypothetical protein QOH86_2127 [Sphingomonadales bacterium]|nr:hypothetical protein [Sphingomonadales bacterium]